MFRWHFSLCFLCFLCPHALSFVVVIPSLLDCKVMQFNDYNWSTEYFFCSYACFMLQKNIADIIKLDQTNVVVHRFCVGILLGLGLM